MPLIPMPQIGGLDIGGNLLSQTSKRARDNLNLSQDVDGTVITRYPSKILEQNGQPLSTYVGGDFTVKAVMPYVGDKDQADPIVMILDESATVSRQWELALWDLSNPVNLPKYMQTSNPAIIDPGTLHEYLPSDFTEMDKLLAFRPQIDGPPLENIFGLCQYDGTKWHRAGLPQPYVPPTLGSPDVYVRMLYASIDFQGNETYGQFITAHLASTAGQVVISPTITGGINANAAGQGSGADRNSLNQGFDDKYLDANSSIVNQVYDPILKTFTMNAVDEHNLVVGDWLQFSFSALGSPNVAADLRAAGSSQIPYLFAFPVLSHTPTSVVFNADPTVAQIYVDQSYWLKASDWIHSAQYNNCFPLDFKSSSHSNTWVLYFTSSSALTGYFLSTMVPVPFAAAVYSNTVDIYTASDPDPVMIDYNPFRFPDYHLRMEDVLDDTTVKIPFPDSVTMVTDFDNLFLAADDNVLYWNDTSFGGSIMMTTGLDNTVVGSSKQGPVVGLAAADEFVFVSRKYRNYSIVGTLPTFNFQVNPYAMAQPGTSHFSNVITVGGSVYFGNSLGMWECFGTNMRNISSSIAGAFYRESDPHYVAGTSVPLRFSALEGSYDSLKGRCVWKVSNPADPTQLDWAIMLDTKTGEWFRWTIMGTNTLQVVNGLWYTANNQNGVSVEDPTRSAGFVPSYYVTSWQTIDAPSLEKQYTQVKVFGRSQNDKNLVITTYRDWSETPIPNEDLVIDPLYELSQKKKVNSNKSLSYSVKVAATPDNQVIQIQGIEIEFNQIQEGMKR